MSIYDEALEEIKKLWNGNELTYPKHTIKALERAKKVEELVGLYRRRPLYINSVQFDEIDKLIKLKEKELEAKE